VYTNEAVFWFYPLILKSITFISTGRLRAVQIVATAYPEHIADDDVHHNHHFVLLTAVAATTNYRNADNESEENEKSFEALFVALDLNPPDFTESP
jgi:hypothetical protein